jgi:hypothetical protein
MPVSNISYITSTYIELIKRGFVRSGEAVPDVLPLSPVNFPGDGISFFLYHVIQKKEYGNFPIPTRDPESRFLPMALTLYYQLSARSINEDENGTYNEQKWMSIAMKAIHDCPFIDDTTLTPNNLTPILDVHIIGNDNRLNISQQPVPYTDAIHNWTAGQAPMKLSAYYEVSTVFLEPDDFTSYSGRVLAYGNYVFLKGAPRITSSQNVITYKLPGETINREIKIQPAQASPAKAPPVVVLPDSIISFYGAGFEGDSVSLRLFNPRFKEPVIAGSDWAITVSGSNSINVTVREKAILERNNIPVDILPGVYSAQAIVKKNIHLTNGQTKELKISSNQFPFIVVPRIDTLGALVGTSIKITGYKFQHIVSGNDVLKDSIEVYLGENRMIRSNAAAIVPGEFKIIDPSTMKINIPGPFNPGMQIPLRILIEGAESRPLWIII